MEERKQLAPPGGIEPVRANRGEYGPEPYEDDPHGGLIEYWRILQRRKGTLILVAFLGLVAGVLFTLPQTPVYQARTTIEIQDINQNFLNMRDVSTTAEPAWGAMYDIQTQIKIVQSNSLMERTANKLKIKKPEQILKDPGRISAWRRALNLPEPKPEDQWDMALATASGSVKARASGQTRIIEMTVDSTDAKMAADFANTLANEFIEQNVESRWQSTQRTGDWLTRQLDDVRIKLEKSEDTLQTYARNSGLLFMSEKSSVVEEKLKQVQVSLSAAQADRVTRQSRWEMANNSPPEALPDVLNDASLREYQTKLTDLRRQMAELEPAYTADHPKVKRLEPQVKTLEAALARERGAILKRIKNEYDEARTKEKLLEGDYRAQALLLTDQGEKAIHYNILKREVDTNRQLYEAMLQRVKESSIAAAMRASNVRVVDPAKAPKAPYKPRLPMNAGLGLLAGLFLGVALVVTTDRANRTLQQPGDMNYYLGLPELGVIPSLLTDPHRKRRVKLHLALNNVSLVPAEDKTERVELVTWQRKHSMLAESFRATLTSILFSGTNGSRPRVLVLTSAGPAEGKTTMAANLAIALAEIGKRVLLIDADMRKPRMQDLFEVNNERGLVTLLRQNKPFDQCETAGLVQETKVPGLFVLTAGPSIHGATNLLYSQHLEGILEKLRTEFEMIVIDTPPMLQIPDARVLGKMADAAVLVVRAGLTTRDAATAARQRLAEDGTPVMGTVLVDWNPKASPGGYYGNYDGYYGKYYRKGYYRRED